MSMLFSSISEKDKVTAIDDLIHDSSPRPSFFLLVILSTVMATLGVIAQNGAVVIGSMLIAPILSPILSLSLGVVMSDSKLIRWSSLTLLKSTICAIGFAAVFTWFFQNGYDTTINNTEIFSRTEPAIIFLIIAIVAGFATAFARAKPNLNEALPGTAIAVALVPPLAVTGIGIATLNYQIAAGAFQMYLLNLIGIVVATIVTFSLMNLYPKRNHASNAQDRESKSLARDKAKAEKLKEDEEKEKEKSNKKK